MVTRIIINSKSSTDIIKMTLTDNAPAIIPRVGEYVMFDHYKREVTSISHVLTPYSHEIRIESL